MSRDTAIAMAFPLAVVVAFLSAAILRDAVADKATPCPCATLPAGKTWCDDFYPPRP